MKKLTIAIALIVAVASLTGCTPHTTEATEVGVIFNKFTRKTALADPGATYFFIPFLNEWRTFDISTQNLVMAAQTGEESGPKDDLRFKTRDGNDIETDITVRWKIDPQKAAYVWEFVAPDSRAVRERLVRPMARSYVRDVLNELDSEQFYEPKLRFEAATKATALMAEKLEPYGVVIEQVIIGNFSFKSEYQNLINQKKESEKNAERLEAEIIATKEANKANLQKQVAQLTEKLTTAEGELERAKTAADAYLVRRQQEAKATLAEKTAAAEGIRQERAALNSSAGDAYVTLQLIEALKKKEIRQIPQLPGNVIVDGNKLLQQLGVIQYEQRRVQSSGNDQ